MKKLTLLFSITIAVIGIQGCTNEENISEQELQIVEQGDIIPKNAINVDDLFKIDNNVKTKSNRNVPICFKKIYVVIYGDSQDNLTLLEIARNYTFSTIFALTEPACTNVFEWYVPCDEVPTRECVRPVQGCIPEYITGGTAVLTPSKKELDDGEDGDPNCGRCEPTPFDFISIINPTCQQVSESFPFSINILN
ncbi:hypothetical protein [Aquimarina sp. MMG016]|uniref:hypothetical protein n=1 Tax=Aquimarina sp. MMG016 TaxID=2822690 RepID=UPI001B3A345E|nr:hypothetical protein [Aquimarina sp. MMG016]MBQ4822810.1 hypothetical protein [Aquimarina sp. MMG016]